MTTTTRELGLAHLSIFELSPAELVRVAAAVGFDFVGVRVRPATPAEVLDDLTPGSVAARETLQALADTGMGVGDIEFIAFDGSQRRDDWLPMLEVGAALGASTVSVASNDADESRFADTLAAFTADAREHDLVPTLEAISYNAVDTIGRADALAASAGAAVLLDPLHLVRSGGKVADLASIDASRIPVAQLCDGPLRTPTELVVEGTLPRGMTADGEPRKVEARAHRLAPGSGEFDLAGFVRALPASTPISVEVPNAALLGKLGVEGYARHLIEATREVLAQADEANSGAEEAA